MGPILFSNQCLGVKHFSWWSPRWSHFTTSTSLVHGAMEKARNERTPREGHRWVRKYLRIRGYRVLKTAFQVRDRTINKYDLFQRKGLSWRLLISFSELVSQPRSVLRSHCWKLRMCHPGLWITYLSFATTTNMGRQTFNMWQRGSSAIYWTIR